MDDLQSKVITQELRTAYLNSVVRKHAELADAVRIRQFKTITRIGHQLKGSGRSYGFAEISVLGAHIEEAGQDRRLCLVEPLLADLLTLINELILSQIAQTATETS